MRVVVQRVVSANVSVDGKTIGQIGKGLVLLAGFAKDDNEEILNFIADKIVNLRIFSDENDKMNLSVLDTRGELLVVSNFTVYGDCRKGRRPSFDKAMPPDKANKMYLRFLEILKAKNVRVESGEFQAMMKVELINDGPVTFIVEKQI